MIITSHGAGYYIERSTQRERMHLPRPRFTDIGMHAKALKGLVNQNRGTNYYAVLQRTGHYASAINYTRVYPPVGSRAARLAIASLVQKRLH